MRQSKAFASEFVKALPNELEEGTLYVSMEYATAAHKCCCGCGREVVTPLSPTDWKLTYDGESISLSPSIGNWSFVCRSHYWIEKSAIQWSDQWSKERILAGRTHDHKAKQRHYTNDETVSQQARSSSRDTSGKDFWSWLSRLWLR